MKVVAVVYERSVEVSTSVILTWYSLMIPFLFSLTGADQLRWRTVELRLVAASSSGGVSGAVKKRVCGIHLLHSEHKAKLPTCFISLNCNTNTEWSSASTSMGSYSNFIHCEGH